ncbi:hypothetical protein K2173_025036 [Erythroxylum novogranatense]|uniref:Uncharacterized protein n=1 Tax=Erythroxylum novogranatense TaxID=1862640 RepID=A0AAV8UD88_9ROSI|nr:hypothetical protein K2173_025036 [Erythroxylum novogranatense]
MSATNCLLLLLLFLSLHACNARRIEKRFQISNQNNRKDASVPSKEELSSSNVQVASKTDSRIDQNDRETSKDSKRKVGAVQKESPVSVPWKVPQNTHREKHPSFNLDYSPPRTHPPSHN